MSHNHFQNLIRPFLTFGASQLLTKLSRLLVVIAISRFMEADAIGLAAAAIAIGDLMKSLTRHGVNQKVIAAPDAEFVQVANGAYRLEWIWILSLLVIQVLTSFIMWQFFDLGIVAIMVAILSLEYLFMPLGVLSFASAMRAPEKRHKVAFISGGQLLLTDLMTVALVILWPHPMAMVLPRVISAPFWLMGMRKLSHWAPDPKSIAKPPSYFLRYAASVLVTEISAVARVQIDKIIIGITLGSAALGEYFFAFNAGLGIATSFSLALATILFSFLAGSEDKNDGLRKGLKLAVFGVVPIVTLQALLAPYYVPLIFGAKWAHISEIVSILCFAAIPTLIWTASAQYYRVHDKAGHETFVAITLAGLIALSTYLLSPYGLKTLALGYLSVTCLVYGLGSYPALYAAFFKSKS